MSIDTLSITLTIDAHENREVAFYDVVGVYFNADMDDFTTLKLEGLMVDLMVQVDPEKYFRFARYEYGKKVLHLRFLKALYGCIKSGLLWYNMYTSTLKDEGFVLNPYYSCVANKMIQSKQCTIVWYVDDFKISHARRTVVDNVISTIERHYDKMAVTRGRKHSYVGIDIEFIGN